MKTTRNLGMFCMIALMVSLVAISATRSNRTIAAAQLSYSSSTISNSSSTTIEQALSSSSQSASGTTPSSTTNDTGGPQYIVGVAPEVIYGGFSPATFVLNFYHTGVINTSIDALNNGLYTYLVQNGQPTSSISFNLNSSDTYIIFIRITYPYAINSNLTWRMTDPGQFPSGGQEGFVKTNIIDLEFQISLLEYFQLPTAEEIANATVFAEHAYLDQQVVNLHNELVALENTTNTIIFWDQVGVILALGFTILAVILVYRKVANSNR